MKANRAIGLLIKELKTPVSILGTSVGGIYVGIAASTYPEIERAFVIAGGVYIAQIIGHSDQQVLVDGKIARMKKWGISSEEEYIKILNDSIFLDPIKMEKKFIGKKLGLLSLKKSIRSLPLTSTF